MHKIPINHWYIIDQANSLTVDSININHLNIYFCHVLDDPHQDWHAASVFTRRVKVSKSAMQLIK